MARIRLGDGSSQAATDDDSAEVDRVFAVLDVETTACALVAIEWSRWHSPTCWA